MTPAPAITDDERAAFRATLRRFVDRELMPHIDAWEEAAEFPRDLYLRAGELGLLGLGFPEAYGGSPGDSISVIHTCEELARTGAGGLIAGLLSHGIGLPPIVNLGSDEQKQRLIPDVLAGRKIAALAISEPSGGSDVANLRTTARRATDAGGDHFVVHGSKMFITSGMRADLITVAVRTGGPGLGGISLLVVDGDSPGLTRTPLKKMGWWCSDTAALYFDECRVPARNLLGQQDHGFLGIMQNFNRERLMLAAMAVAFARVCYDEALAWASQRETFGKPLVRHQVIRHKLVDMATAHRTSPLLAVRSGPPRRRRRVADRPAVHAQERRHQLRRALRPRGRADPRRRRVHARDQGRAHLSRDQGPQHRRRRRRDHEGPRLPPARLVIPP